MHRLPLPTSAESGQFDNLISAARRHKSEPEDVAELAVHLACSGQRISWPLSTNPTDIASTGSPGSLSTLLSPLSLVACGHEVIKLAVPGRPAGAIDVLATIPGYRPNLTLSEVNFALKVSGFAHFLANGLFAPLDAALYKYRRQNSAVAIPSLAAASLLSKKVAVGIKTIGLDVRVGPYGNFGTNFAEARVFSQLFCKSARLLGISSVAFLTDASGPAQPWLGRGESLVALAKCLEYQGFANTGCSWLKRHAAECFEMARVVSVLAAKTNNDSLLSRLSSPPQLKQIREALARHLVAQGSSEKALRSRLEELNSAIRTPICLEGEGILEVRMDILRDAITETQQDPKGRFTDFAGIHFLVSPGRYIQRGETVATVRLDARYQSLYRKIQSAFSVTQGSEWSLRQMEVVDG